jgi:hypothetical protein
MEKLAALPVGKKKKVTQADIARACRLDQGSVSRILNKDTRDSFSAETVQHVFTVARELGYVHPALVNTNRRQSPRKKAFFKGTVSIVIGTNTVYDRGDVEIHEISGSGILLKNFSTKKNSLPMDRFRLDVEIASGPLKGLKARCDVVRFSNNENEFGLAVQFAEIEDRERRRIARFTKANRRI